MADQSGRAADQPVPQSSDHGLAAADAMAEQLTAGLDGRGELVQPAGNARCAQRCPPRRGVDLGVAGGR
ncbi:MAG: hypothetical protein JO287_08155 [Pseudonocardiales bacterium]|nr:hypothetical protein [Pseudonocardiales bacterium]